MCILNFRAQVPDTYLNLWIFEYHSQKLYPISLKFMLTCVAVRMLAKSCFAFLAVCILVNIWLTLTWAISRIDRSNWMTNSAFIIRKKEKMYWLFSTNAENFLTNEKINSVLGKAWILETTTWYWWLKPATWPNELFS